MQSVRTSNQPVNHPAQKQVTKITKLPDNSNQISRHYFPEKFDLQKNKTTKPTKSTME